MARIRPPAPNHKQTKLSFQIQKLDPYPKHCSNTITSREEAAASSGVSRCQWSAERFCGFFLFEGFHRAPNQIWRWEMYLAFPPRAAAEGDWVSWWLEKREVAKKMYGSHTQTHTIHIRDYTRSVAATQTEPQPVVSWLRSFQLPHQWSLDSRPNPAW